MRRPAPPARSPCPGHQARKHTAITARCWISCPSSWRKEGNDMAVGVPIEIRHDQHQVTVGWRSLIRPCTWTGFGQPLTICGPRSIVSTACPNSSRSSPLIRIGWSLKRRVSPSSRLATLTVAPITVYSICFLIQVPAITSPNGVQSPGSRWGGFH